MKQTMQQTMETVAIDQFGGIDTLVTRTLPVPDPGPNQILLRVESAGVGKWDAFEREGLFAKMFGGEPTFPYVLGTEGAGTVTAVGERVSRFHEGDRVYGLISANTRGRGFYAEYTVVDADMAWPVPEALPTIQAGAMPIDAGTALRGIRDVLALERGNTLLILGASGGIGHFAVQLAERMGIRVVAVASGDDGVALAKRLGADIAIEGHSANVPTAARELAPGGVDAALLTTGGEAAEHAVAAVRDGGRAAFPNGVQSPPEARPGVRVESFDADFDSPLMNELDRLIVAAPFEVHLGRTFALDEVAAAHRALSTHYLGRITLLPG